MSKDDFQKAWFLLGEEIFKTIVAAVPAPVNSGTLPTSPPSPSSTSRPVHSGPARAAIEWIKTLVNDNKLITSEVVAELRDQISGKPGLKMMDLTSPQILALKNRLQETLQAKLKTPPEPPSEEENAETEPF